MQPAFEYGQEIDFMLEDKTLIEAKYHREIENKQLVAFNKIKASQKIVIRNYADLADYIQNNK